MQHDGDVLHAVALGAGGYAVHGLPCIAGFQPGRAGVAVDELVGICERKAPVTHGVHPDGRVVADARVCQQCARHDGNVPRGRVVRGVVGQPGGIEKVRVFHAECLRALVHTLGKGRLRAADMLGHGDGAVIGGAHGDAFDHLVDGHLFSLPEPDLAAAHGARVGAGGDHGIRGEPAAVELLEDEQQRHDLRYACGGEALVGVLLIEHRTGLALDQDRRRRADAQLLL